MPGELERETSSTTHISGHLCRWWKATSLPKDRQTDRMYFHVPCIFRRFNTFSCARKDHEFVSFWWFSLMNGSDWCSFSCPVHIFIGEETLKLFTTVFKYQTPPNKTSWWAVWKLVFMYDYCMLVRGACLILDERLCNTFELLWSRILIQSM